MMSAIKLHIITQIFIVNHLLYLFLIRIKHLALGL